MFADNDALIRSNLNPNQVIQPDPALAAEENRKRKRKDRKGGGPETRELTGYNKFMREELAAIKESSPSLDNREAYKLALSKVSQPGATLSSQIRTFFLPR